MKNFGKINGIAESYVQGYFRDGIVRFCQKKFCLRYAHGGQVLHGRYADDCLKLFEKIRFIQIALLREHFEGDILGKMFVDIPFYIQYALLVVEYF